MALPGRVFRLHLHVPQVRMGLELPGD
jgi:hypothetical protein